MSCKHKFLTLPEDDPAQISPQTISPVTPALQGYFFNLFFKAKGALPVVIIHLNSCPQTLDIGKGERGEHLPRKELPKAWG